MEVIENFISLYLVELAIGLVVGVLLLLILTIQTRYMIKKISEKYDALVAETSGINIEDILMDNHRSIKDLNQDLKQLDKKFSNLEFKQSFSIQKIGFIRYNAYDNVGNELSYSIALLDSYNSGFVLSSLYGRDSSLNYSKPLKNGKSRIPLSAEEQIAIDRALKGDNVEKVF